MSWVAAPSSTALANQSAAQSLASITPAVVAYGVVAAPKPTAVNNPDPSPAGYAIG